MKVKATAYVIKRGRCGTGRCLKIPIFNTDFADFTQNYISICFILKLNLFQIEIFNLDNQVEICFNLIKQVERN